MSVGVNFTPWIGTGKAFKQAFTGKDLITGKSLTFGDRIAEGVGGLASFIPIPGLKNVGKYGTKAAISVGKKVWDIAKCGWKKYIGTTTKKKSSKGNKNKGNIDDFAKEPFLPDEAYGKNLPKFVEPGTKSLNKYDELGNLKQTKYYDDYGREKGWVDFTDHGYPQNHSVPHWHEVQWNERYPIGGYKIDHRMDTNIPFK